MKWIQASHEINNRHIHQIPAGHVDKMLTRGIAEEIEKQKLINYKHEQYNEFSTTVRGEIYVITREEVESLGSILASLTIEGNTLLANQLHKILKQ